MGNISSVYVPTPTMIFIDGGWLKKWLKDVCNLPVEDFNFGTFCKKMVEHASLGLRKNVLIRTYFYDGLADPSETEYQKQKQFHDILNKTLTQFEVRVGRLVRDGEGKFRQKAVDVLMAIDMIEKAYSEQYQVAIIVTGDLDHIETIRNVKNRGKQIYGVCDEKNTSAELLANFDSNHFLKKDVEGKFTLIN